MHCACHPSQFLAEHFCAELPTLGALAAPLTQLSIAVQVFFFYYNAHKKTKGPKSLVWAGVAMFFAGLAFFGGLEVGLPKDTPAEQAVANLDPTHALWHLLLHTYLVMHAAVVTYNVPWETKEVTSTPPCSPSSAFRMCRGKRKSAPRLHVRLRPGHQRGWPSHSRPHEQQR